MVNGMFIQTEPQIIKIRSQISGLIKYLKTLIPKTT